MNVKYLIRKNNFIDHVLKKRYAKNAIRNSFQFPTSIHIEPTNLCNLSCTMCPRIKSLRSLGSMNFTLFTKIIDEIASEVRSPKISFHKDGEPLLNHDIFKMVSYARKKIPHAMLRFSTNGLLLTPAKTTDLFEAGLDSITISLDGVTKATYEKIRINGDFDKLIKNIEYLISYKEKHGFKSPQILVQSINMDETKNEISAFKNRWKGIADGVAIKPLLHWTEQCHIDHNGRYPCLSLWVNPAISWNGDVSLCCTYINCQDDDKGIVGNVKSNSLKNIWQGIRLQKIRMVQLHGNYNNPPFCATCQDWKYGIKSLNIWSEAFKHKVMSMENKKIK